MTNLDGYKKRFVATLRMTKIVVDRSLVLAINYLWEIWCAAMTIRAQASASEAA